MNAAHTLSITHSHFSNTTPVQWQLPSQIYVLRLTDYVQHPGTSVHRQFNSSMHINDIPNMDLDT